jgi:S-formylglutathione hydrolase
MWSYLSDDLSRLLVNAFPVDEERQAITGHSMGGHGALTMALAHPGRFRSVSALAPICHPSASEWGRKQLTAYLGTDEAAWTRHDAVLALKAHGFDGPMLIDQGTADAYLDNLMPETLAQTMAARRQGGVLRMQAGYDHSYFFVASFMADHIAFHADALRG